MYQDHHSIWWQPICSNDHVSIDRKYNGFVHNKFRWFPFTIRRNIENVRWKTYDTLILWSVKCCIILNRISWQFLDFIPFEWWSFLLQETTKQCGETLHFPVVEISSLFIINGIQQCLQLKFEMHQCISFSDFVEFFGIGCITLMTTHLQIINEKILNDCAEATFRSNVLIDHCIQFIKTELLEAISTYCYHLFDCCCNDNRTIFFSSWHDRKCIV